MNTANETDEDTTQRITAWANYLGAHSNAASAVSGHEAFMAGYAAGRNHSRTQIEELADSFEDSIDWSDGRNNYGDNDAYAACARDLRKLLADGDQS